MSRKANFNPVVLSDDRFFPELCQLRVHAWENSRLSDVVNSTLFPNGWSDPLDHSPHTAHIVIFNSNEQIIAGGRVNFFNTLQELPFYKNIMPLQLPHSTPLAFYSRLVVNKHYRNKGLSRIIDEYVVEFCAQKKMKWIIALSNLRADVYKNKLGYKIYGNIDIKYHKESCDHSVHVIAKTLE